MGVPDYSRENRGLSTITRHSLLPSAAFLAREFKLRFKGEPVTDETCRRRMRGLSVPRPERMVFLVNWLEINWDWTMSSDQVGGSNAPTVDRDVNVSLASTEEARDLVLARLVHLAKGLDSSELREAFGRVLEIYKRK